MAARNYKVRSRIWIERNDGPYLGNGRIKLLEAIQKEGSISKAANSMNMSYVKAWKLIDKMNESADRPLVVRTSGGAGGGGSVLTEHGLKIIKIFNALNRKCELLVDRELSKVVW